MITGCTILIISGWKGSTLGILHPSLSAIWDSFIRSTGIAHAPPGTNILLSFVVLLFSENKAAFSATNLEVRFGFSSGDVVVRCLLYCKNVMTYIPVHTEKSAMKCFSVLRLTLILKKIKTSRFRDISSERYFIPTCLPLRWKIVEYTNVYPMLVPKMTKCVRTITEKYVCISCS